MNEESLIVVSCQLLTHQSASSEGPARGGACAKLVPIVTHVCILHGETKFRQPLIKPDKASLALVCSFVINAFWSTYMIAAFSRVRKITLNLRQFAQFAQVLRVGMLWRKLVI